jgi:type IV pilus assembly protein PilA
MQPLNTSKYSNQSESGFTLVELLVVVLIIGILSAIAVPIFLNQRKQALDAQLKSDMKTVATWLENNKVKNPSASYPRIAKSWYAPNGSATDFANWPSDITLSKATGIITSDSGDSQMFFAGNSAPAGAGFCIEGQVLNSDFDLTALVGPQRMWYNSLKGGFTTSCQL